MSHCGETCKQVNKKSIYLFQRNTMQNSMRKITVSLACPNIRGTVHKLQLIWLCTVNGFSMGCAVHLGNICSEGLTLWKYCRLCRVDLQCTWMCLGFPYIQQLRQSCYSGETVPDNCQHSQIHPQQNCQDCKRACLVKARYKVGKEKNPTVYIKLQLLTIFQCLRLSPSSRPVRNNSITYRAK